MIIINRLLRLVAGTVLVAGLVVGLSFISMQAADAQSTKQAACEGSGGTWKGDPDTSDTSDGICTTPGQTRTVTSTIQQVANILIFIVGAVSVIMIIIGGLRYSLAQGDQTAVGAAKNTIIYAVAGLVLAFGAYAIVNFVITGLNQ